MEDKNIDKIIEDIKNDEFMNTSDEVKKDITELKEEKSKKQ